MKHYPLGAPMIGFATFIVETANKTLTEIGVAVEEAIDSATESAKERNIKLTNIQVVPITTNFTAPKKNFQETGLLLVFQIGRN